jgi:hypothetical protein
MSKGLTAQKRFGSRLLLKLPLTAGLTPTAAMFETRVTPPEAIAPSGGCAVRGRCAVIREACSPQ